MKIGHLSPARLADILRNEGLFFETGSLTIHLKSELPEAAAAIHRLYADFGCAEQPDFADFHVHLSYPSGIRRWFRRQVRFFHDAKSLFNPLPARLAFPFFEWGTNWCISRHAHQFLMIHSAVLERSGRAVFLTARPGGGKSTLCAALAHRGWRLFSDEFGLIRISDGAVIPLPRPVALKNESIDVIRRYVPEAVFGPVYESMDGGTLAHLRPPAGSVRSSKETAIPGLILFVEFVPDSGLKLIPVERSVAFLRLADNAFNYSLLGATGFEALARVIEASACHELTYSDLDCAVKAIGQLMPPELEEPEKA